MIDAGFAPETRSLRAPDPASSEGTRTAGEEATLGRNEVAARPPSSIENIQQGLDPRMLTFYEYLRAREKAPFSAEDIKRRYEEFAKEHPGNREEDWICVVDENIKDVHTIEKAAAVIRFVKRMMEQYRGNPDAEIRKTSVMRSFYTFSFSILDKGVEKKAEFMLYRKGARPGIAETGSGDQNITQQIMQQAEKDTLSEADAAPSSYIDVG